MALNALKCNHLAPLGLKGLMFVRCRLLSPSMTLKWSVTDLALVIHCRLTMNDHLSSLYSVVYYQFRLLRSVV